MNQKQSGQWSSRGAKRHQPERTFPAAGNVRRHGVALAALALVMLVVGWLPARAGEAQPAPFKHPVMRVPKLTEAPQIDGTIDPAEWARAAAFTGVTAEGNVGGHGSLVPEVQQVQWFLAYDDTYLYLAMRSPHPKGTYPVARVKENDLVIGHPAVLFEDHIEVQILTHGRRDLATTQGHGFYKIMANAKAAVMDEFLYNGTDGSESLWSMGGPLKCRVTPEVWELEMAVELARMDIENLDGRDLVIQLVRTDSCTGMYFAGWVGTSWLSWGQFAQVSFVPDTPAVRFLKLGEIGAGTLDAVVELSGGKEPADVSVVITVTDADEKTIHTDTRNVALAAGVTERLNFTAADLPISQVAVPESHGKLKRRNHFEITATAKIGGEEVVLYRNRSPFMQVDDEFRANFLDKWIAGRPQSGEWESKIAYLPYSDRLEASVDLDFFGMPEKVLKAAAYRVEVSAKGKKRTLASGEGTISNLIGAPILISLPELAAGDYVARVTLTDAKGKELDNREVPFQRKIFPWENNRLGISDDNEVIPPFFPLQVGDHNTLRVWGKGWHTASKYEDSIALWGRIYAIGANGLPSQIETAPPTGASGGAEPLLARPIQLEVQQGGQIFTGEGTGKSYTGKARDRVDLAGSLQAGPLKADITAFVEYDGWYEVTAQLSGQGTIEAADLVIDFDDQGNSPIDTLYVQRLSDGQYGNVFAEIPREPGVHFKSTDLLKVTGSKLDWKSFVPRTYVGNGDRGLWFFAWSQTGWEMQDDQPVSQVERLANGDVRLRVRLLAGPVDLDTPRTLRFALQAAPVKPNHPRYRTFNEEGLDTHDTRGWRYYGESVNSYVNTRDEDYEELRKFVLYGLRHQGEAQRTVKGNWGWWHTHYMENLAHGAALTMYGSGQLTGHGAEEFKTFGGEWLGSSNWQPGRSAASMKGRWNYQGTTEWLSDEQLSVGGVNWSQSMIDFFIWYHKPLMEKSGFNGTWWDNVSISLVRDYNPELGRIEEVWIDYPRRQLVKRLNVLGWQLMRPPRWAANMHVDLGFAQTFWMVENNWYADGKDMTTLDQWPIGRFRAMTRTKSTVQVARPWLGGFGGTTPEKKHEVGRSVPAMLMSHDVHAAPGSALGRLRGLVNLPDTKQCLFTGYWRSGNMVQTSGTAVHASVYANTSWRTAAVLLFNGADGEQQVGDVTLNINAILPIRGESLNVRRVFDLESGETLATAVVDGKTVLAAPLAIGRHGYRLIGIEAE